MLFSKKDRWLLAAGCMLLVGVIAALAFYLTASMSAEKKWTEPEDAVTHETKSEPGEDAVFEADTVASLDEYILDKLSLAEYKTLDSHLAMLANTYRDGDGGETGLDTSYSGVIDMYRADLAVIMGIQTSQNPDLSLQGYYFPETLASAFIYSDVSAKMDAILEPWSVIIPGILSADVLSTNLRFANLTAGEKFVLLGLMQEKLPDKTLTGVEQMSFHAYEADWSITLVCLDNYLWYVAEMNCLNGNDGAFMTAETLKAAKAAAIMSGQSFDADAFYKVAP